MGFFMNIQLLNAQSQKINVTGVVKDAMGETIIGASVLEKGTTNGTITDLEGSFSLAVASNSTLVVSYIGYTSQEIPVSGKSSFNIILREDSKVLDEVVVIGYGTMRKKDLTGSIVQIRPDKLANENPKTVQDILRGTPGLQVGYDASAKGGGSMQIRGQRSVYTDGGHNDPLIILDGMMFYGELSEINPDDIEQIDILKDASAAAVYGAKAANGAVIIVTKKGKVGKPSVNVTTNISFTQKSAYREVFDTEGYIQYREDWQKRLTYDINPATGKYEPYQTSEKRNGYFERPENLSKYGVSLEDWRAYTTNTAGESDASIYAKRLGLNASSLLLENYLAGKTYNWFDNVFQTGFSQDYNASVSGANDKMNYYLSFGYLNNEGAVKGNEYSAIRSNMKLEGKVTKWLEVGANVNFQQRSDGDIQVGLGTNYWDDNEIWNSPYASHRDDDGNLVYQPMGNDGPIYQYNYDFNRQYLDLEKGYTIFNSIVNAKVYLPFNITYSFNVSPRFQFFYDRYFVSSDHPARTAKDSQVNREQTKRFDYSLNNTINWDYTFNRKHHVILTLVQEAEERRSWLDRIEAKNILPTDALGLHNTENATKADSSFKSTDTHQTADALLARGFYSYADRYMVTASIRRDGYSAFGQSNPYATFPSIALGWTFTNEEFFKWEPMDYGKLRISWGENGNRSLSNPYVSLANLGSGTGTMQGYVSGTNTYLVKYLIMDRLANPNLQWEKSQAWNIGLDYSFLNNRISGSIEYYKTITRDMIMAQRLPEFSGFASITTNLGEVHNSGFELSVNTLNIKNENFEWRTTLGLSYNKNEIKHLYYENEDILDATGNVIGSKEMDDTSNGWFIGQPINTIWNYRVTGIWQVDEIDEAAKYGQKPGDPKVANIYTADDVVNVDGSVTPVYNDNDKEFLGTTAPPIHWSLHNEFTLWKNLSLSFNIYSYMGHKSTETYYLNNDNGGSRVTNAYNVFAKEYWTPENPSNTYARLDASGPSGAVSAPRLHDRSFIRLENISVGYTLPKAWTSKLEIDRLKFFGSIRNVGVWQKDWEYGDPETSGLATRVFTLGLNATF
ncbi:MAG: SusC/RagA family TonB-linked outer membrane protein [Mediterranea sp.]|nr:SusC/RagA family TonB-linked outer membrane protein [Mediterranea sp.]